jgi:hypothetical protein
MLSPAAPLSPSAAAVLTPARLAEVYGVPDAVDRLPGGPIVCDPDLGAPALPGTGP